MDLSAVDPLAPRYKEWEERAKKFQTTTYAWDGGRVVSAEVVKGGKPVARTTYAYDCP